MEKGVPPHPFPCLSCGVSGSPGNQEPEVPPPRVPIACVDEINFFEDLTKILFQSVNLYVAIDSCSPSSI